MSNALADVTNKLAKAQVNEAALERVKEANWGAPEGFDYVKYNAGPRDKTASASESDQLHGISSNWGANAAKYEWDDDFGDVGPEHDVLKQMLFGDEHKMEQGEEFSKLVTPFTCQRWLALLTWPGSPRLPSPSRARQRSSPLLRYLNHYSRLRAMLTCSSISLKMLAFIP